MIKIDPYNPLAEIFGYPIHNVSPGAISDRENRFCPFHNGTPKCTKTDKLNPLGVCSMYHKSAPVITCPVRFRENWTMIADAARFFFGNNKSYLPLSEVRLKDREGRHVGNIDYALVLHDERGRILDFASLEVQSVYISGKIRGAFTTYMETQSPDFNWKGALKYPRPDYLSSSNKRLIPQMLIKGGIFNKWGKKQAVATQTTFFNQLPVMPEVSPEEADLVWLLYDLIPTGDEQRYKLTHVRSVYTQFKAAILKFVDPEAGDVHKFIQGLQKVVDEKLGGKSRTSIDFEDFMNPTE